MKPTARGCGLGFGEVGEFDAPADVEGRGAGVADEVGGSGDTQQAEGEAVEVGIFGPSVVALSDAGEELIGGEGQAADGIDLIHEDHQLARPPLQHHLVEALHPALHRTRRRVPARHRPARPPDRPAGPAG